MLRTPFLTQPPITFHRQHHLLGLYQLKWRRLKITGLLLFPEDQNCPKKATLSREFLSLLIREGFSKVQDKAVVTGTCNSAPFQLFRNLHSISIIFFSITDLVGKKKQNSWQHTTPAAYLKLVSVVIWDSFFIWTATTATHDFFRRPSDL